MFGNELLGCNVSSSFKEQKVPVLLFSLFVCFVPNSRFFKIDSRQILTELEELGVSSSIWMRMRIFCVYSFGPCAVYSFPWLLIPSSRDGTSPACGIFLCPTYVTKITVTPTIFRQCRSSSLSDR